MSHVKNLPTNLSSAALLKLKEASEKQWFVKKLANGYNSSEIPSFLIVF